MEQIDEHGTSRKQQVVCTENTVQTSHKLLDAPAVRWCSEKYLPQLSESMTHVWTQEFDVLGFFQKWSECLDIEERTAASEFATYALHRRYVAAHYFLRIVLGRYLERAPVDVFLCRGKFGKPALMDGTLEFSMTHTDRRVLVAVSDRPLGVDAEELGEVPEWRLIAERWFSQQEREWIGMQPNPHEAFLRCWVRREALVKAIGTGLSTPFDTLAVTPPPATTEMMYSGKLYSVNELKYQDDHSTPQWVLALASLQ